MNDYYSVLELSNDATFDEIKKSYRKLSLKYHPDRNPDRNSSKVFQRLNEAYDILSDENREKTL